mgnify:FL=1
MEVKKVPNIKSAKKRVNVIKRQAEENIPVRGSMRTAVKKAIKKTDDANLVNDAIKKIDTAAKKGVIKKNTAARKKSRLMKKVNSK